MSLRVISGEGLTKRSVISFRSPSEDALGVKTYKPMRLTGYSDSRGSLATALRSRVVSHSPGLIDVDENRWNKHERRLANEAMPHTGPVYTRLLQLMVGKHLQ